MKKILIVFCLIFMCFGAFAQDGYVAFSEEQDPFKIELIQGNIISEDLKKGGKVVIEFMPAYDEARVVYTCPTPLFEQSIAMLAIKESITSFIKERGYYFYTYLKSDDTKFDAEKRTAIYTSYIQLLH